MTHLAKEFALSDVAVHKICRKHDIPNPPLGWWAKKAAGKAVKQIPLPKIKSGISDRITIAAGELRPEPELIAAARENARLLASSIDENAALPTNHVQREEQARQREEERRQRELVLRRDHIAERRGKALEEALEEMASLDRLRRLVEGLRGEALSGSSARVAEFLGLAERRLAACEAALSADGLEQRFKKQRLFGDDDDHAFRPPYGYY